MFRNLILQKFSHFSKNGHYQKTGTFMETLRTLTTGPFRWKNKKEGESTLEETEQVPRTMSSKYELFSEKNAPIILDIEEERKKMDEAAEQTYDPFQGISTQRGIEGIFDIQDLVELLRSEKAKDIFVVRIPPEYRYANYMVIVTGKSNRHMTAMAEFVRRVYKMKLKSQNGIPSIEGKNSNEWKAIDLNNIVLHIFSESARKHYDLETLWSVGKEYDLLSNTEDSALDSITTDYSSILAELMPDKPPSENDIQKEKHSNEFVRISQSR